MLCGKWKEEKSIVCRECFQTWLKLWQRSEAPAIIKWVVEKAKSCRSSMPAELKKAEEDLDTFKANIKKEAQNEVTRALIGVKIPEGDVSAMVETKRIKLWDAGNGDKLYGTAKRTKCRSENLQGFIGELEDKIEQYEEKEGQEGQEGQKQ